MTRARTFLSRAFIVAGCIGALLAPGIVPDGPAGADATSYHGSLARAVLNRPIVDMASTPTGSGYWLVASDGGIFGFGDAVFQGSTGHMALNQPIVGMASTPTGGGYWLVASDGGIFSFGNAVFRGSTGAIALNRPIVGMAATPTGKGYWLVASDGGIFSFGDAVFHGSTGAIALNSPIVGMASTPTGKGYWLVAADGGIFGFGDATFFGSMAGTALVSPITGLATTRGGQGYWMVAEDGGIFTFGDAKFLGGSTAAPAQTTVDIAPSPGGGYWIATTFGAVHVATETGVFLVDPNLAARTPDDAIATELVARINAERSRRGLSIVSWHPRMTEIAEVWANELARTGAFAHQNLQSALNANSGTFNFLAENIYTGTGTASDSGSAHAALMRSDPHRQTMLLPQLQYVGIGVVCVGNKVVVVEDFSIGQGGALPTSNAMPAPQPFVSADEAGTRCG